nr:hypothetical protein [Tanacetum cinerariifolium]
VEGSGTPTKPHHTPSPKVQQTSPTTHSSLTLPPITTASISIVTPSDTPHLRQYTRRSRIAQSLALPPVANELASPLRDVSQGKACPTDSGFEADQERANIVKTSTLPHESTSRVTSLAADKGSMQHKLDELTTLCTSLQKQQSEMVSRFEAQKLEINSLKARIKLLEDKDRGVAEHSRDDDLGVSTGSGSIPTAGPPATGVPTGSDVVPTDGPIFSTATVVTPYTRRKGKETMVESETPKKKKIARDAKIARIHAEEELQIMINGLDKSNETVAKYLQEYHQFATELPFERRKELISDLVRYQDNYAKEEGEMFKRKGIRFEQESVKKLKTSEEVKASEEVPEEKRGFESVMEISKGIPQHQATYQWQRDGAVSGAKKAIEPDDEDQLSIHASGEGLPPQERSSDCDDLLQASSGKLLLDGNWIIEFPLPGEIPTASEESSHYQKKRDATAQKIALLLKSSSNWDGVNGVGGEEVEDVQ